MDVKIEVTELKGSKTERRKQSDRTIRLPGSSVNWDTAKERALKVLTQDGWAVRTIRIKAGPGPTGMEPVGLLALVSKRGAVAPSRAKR
jgi:hypothetical protein